MPENSTALSTGASLSSGTISTGSIQAFTTPNLVRELSGTYTGTSPPVNGGANQTWTARVDVDGVDPLWVLSVGTWRDGTAPVHTLVDLSPQDDQGPWTGPVTGAGSIDSVKLEEVQGGLRLHLRQGSAVQLTVTLGNRVDSFRKLTVELEVEQGVAYPLTWNTAGTGPAPPGWVHQDLSLDRALDLAGIHVTTVSGGAAILEYASDAPGDTDSDWDDIELHDAMVANWQRTTGDTWYVSVLAVGLHEDGRSLAGLMFDGPASSDTPQRQGCAVFRKAYLHGVFTGSSAALGAQSLEEAARNRIFTMVHEVGHALNLAHSWEKTLQPSTVPLAGAWLPVVDDPDARSWMNYPSSVAGFWNDFVYRFGHDELRFLRHAPEEYVVMGGSPFFVNHALDSSKRYPARVEVKGDTSFGALEPVRISVKLTRRGPIGWAIGPRVGVYRETLVVLVKEAEGWRPLRSYVSPLRTGGRDVILPGESRWADLFLGGEPGAGRRFADPGVYRVQVVARSEAGLLGVSPEFEVEVREPTSAELPFMEAIRGEAMTRLYAFEGSHALTRGTGLVETSPELRLPTTEATSSWSSGGTPRSPLEPTRLAWELARSLEPGSPAALHAALVADGASTRPRRLVVNGKLRVIEGDREAAERAVRAFVGAGDRAAANPAHYAGVVRKLGELLVREGRIDEALARARSARGLLLRVADPFLSAEVGVLIQRWMRRRRRG